MKKLINWMLTTITVIALVAGLAWAASTYTTYHSLEMPAKGDLNWHTPINNNMIAIDSLLAFISTQSSSTVTFNKKLVVPGFTITNATGVNMGLTFPVGWDIPPMASGNNGLLFGWIRNTTAAGSSKFYIRNLAVVTDMATSSTAATVITNGNHWYGDASKYALGTYAPTEVDDYWKFSANTAPKASDIVADGSTQAWRIQCADVGITRYFSSVDIPNRALPYRFGVWLKPGVIDSTQSCCIGLAKRDSTNPGTNSDSIVLGFKGSLSATAYMLRVRRGATPANYTDTLGTATAAWHYFEIYVNGTALHAYVDGTEVTQTNNNYLIDNFSTGWADVPVAYIEFTDSGGSNNYHYIKSDMQTQE